MEIKNRLFPYPVLCEDTDDYIEGGFTVETNIINQDINSIVLHFRMILDNQGLKKQITLGNAEYIIHIECSNTAFRTVIHTFSDEEVYRINSSKVNGEVSFVGLVVAKKGIPFYRNNSLNADYNDVDIMIPEAAILAYYNMPKINVIKNYEELSNEESLFSVVRKIRMDQNEEYPVSFELSKDRIKIYVSDDVYRAYLHYHHNSTMRPLILSVLVMPALTYMMEVLRADYDEYMGCRWFAKLIKFYQQQGKDFIEDIIEGEAAITEIVQEMLQLPIGKTFINMQEVIGD